MTTYLNPHALTGFDEATKGSVLMKNGDELSFSLVDDGKLPKVFITGEIPMEKGPKNPAVIEYVYRDEHWLQYITIALQGNSSLSYPKKNFNIVMYGDDETRSSKHKTQFPGWDPYNKFTLKANYIDPTHARNIISCRLFADAVKTRDAVPDQRLLETPMMGMIDGFKIQLYINGYYQGMYTWNIAKGEWMFGMKSSDKGSFWLGEAVNDNRTMFRSTITQEELDTEEFWTEEFVGDGNTQEEVLESYNNLVNFVMNSSDEEFKTDFDNYIDLCSVIDYYLFCYYFCGLDQLSKNLLIATYDPADKWFCSLYDADSTWGAWWTGTSVVTPLYACPGDYECANSLLWERLEKNFSEELYARYHELTDDGGLWDISTIITKIEEFYFYNDHYFYNMDGYINPEKPTATDLLPLETFMASRKQYADSMFISMLGIDEIIPASNEITVAVGQRMFVIPSYLPETVKYASIYGEIANPSKCTVDTVTIGILRIDGKSVGDTVLTIYSSKEPTISTNIVVHVISEYNEITSPVEEWRASEFTSGSTSLIGSINGTEMLFTTKFDDPVQVYKDSNGDLDFRINTKDGGELGWSADVSSLGIGSNACTVEFEGKVATWPTYMDVISITSDSDFEHDKSVGIHTNDFNLDLYCEGKMIAAGLDVEAPSRYSHFILCRNSNGNIAGYANIDGKVQEFIAPNSLRSLLDVNYLDSHEDSNYFNGLINRVAIYNYCMDDTQVKLLLGVADQSQEITDISMYGPITRERLDAMADDQSINVMIANPNAVSGFFLGYYGSSLIKYGNGIGIAGSMSDDAINEMSLNIKYSNDYRFELWKRRYYIDTVQKLVANVSKAENTYTFNTSTTYVNPDTSKYDICYIDNNNIQNRDNNNCALEITFKGYTNFPLAVYNYKKDDQTVSNVYISVLNSNEIPTTATNTVLSVQASRQQPQVSSYIQYEFIDLDPDTEYSFIVNHNFTPQKTGRDMTISMVWLPPIGTYQVKGGAYYEITQLNVPENKLGISQDTGYLMISSNEMFDEWTIERVELYENYDNLSVKNTLNSHLMYISSNESIGFIKNENGSPTDMVLSEELSDKTVFYLYES